ncbi:MAG: DUF433 domain-containing protein [Chloroflexota bacterium]|nr:DUF433 domain-containing protein [Chloroflexota bacterium]
MSAVLRTEHPHIVMSPGVAGATPMIAGTRISVALIVGLLRAGDTPQDILATYPHLAPAAVYDAISYYYDHQEEIDRFIRDNTLEAQATRYGFSVGDDGRLRFGRR